MLNVLIIATKNLSAVTVVTDVLNAKFDRAAKFRIYSSFAVSIFTTPAFVSFAHQILSALIFLIILSPHHFFRDASGMQHDQHH
jgi:hypothetical protein